MLTCQLRCEGVDTVGSGLNGSLLGRNSSLQLRGSFRIVGQRRYLLLAICQLCFLLRQILPQHEKL